MTVHAVTTNTIRFDWHAWQHISQSFWAFQLSGLVKEEVQEHNKGTTVLLMPKINEKHNCRSLHQLNEYVNPPVIFKFTNTPLNPQKMIVIKMITHFCVSGTLCPFVDYLNTPLDKTSHHHHHHPPYTSRIPFTRLWKNVQISIEIPDFTHIFKESSFLVN